MFVKICGVTSLEDAARAVEAGADAVGLNFVRSSPRYLEPHTAREIALALQGKAQRIGVVADLSRLDMTKMMELCELDRWQLAGHEPPEVVRDLLPLAFKSCRIGSAADVEEAERCPGEWLLVDAKVDGRLGGTGQTIDWQLVAPLAARRRLILAGGLSPENVAAAVALVRPWGVDVCSGVEVPGDPRRKDTQRMRRFVEAARSA